MDCCPSNGRSGNPVNGAGAASGNSLGKIPASLWQKAVLFSVAYFLCALASNYLSPPAIPFRIFWLPAGLYLAMLLLNQTRSWPWLILAAFTANLAFDLVQGTPLAVLFSFFGATTVQAVTGAWLMRRFVAERPNLRTAKEFFWITIILGIGSTMLGAIIGATTLVASGLNHSFGQSWLTWWFDNMSAVMVVTPLILVWFSGHDEYQQHFFSQRKKYLEAALLMVASFAVCGYFLLFSNGIMSPNKSPILLVLMWAGIRFGTRGATAIGVLVALTFLFFTTQYFTGLTQDQISSGIYITPLQVAWVMASLVGLLPAIVLRQRDEKMEELRVSETKFRTLHDSARDAIFMMQGDHFISCNPATLAMYGCREEDIIGQTPARFSPSVQPDGHGSSEKAAEKIRLALAGASSTFEWRHCKLDGTGFDAEVSLNRMELNGDYFLQATVRDITERKRAEAELKRHREHLEELVAVRTADLQAANRELEAFSFSVSHDLRAPLRAIAGYSDILLLSCAPSLTQTGQRMLNEIAHQSSLMGQLIDDLLAFSRTGRQAIQSVSINMDALAQEAFAEQCATNPKCAAQITTRPLPPAFADPAMIRVVLNNLLSNAIKYSSKRNPPLIEMGGSAQGAQNVYFVKDNGAGFDMQHADKLFGVFQRLHSKAEFEGTGIGLALVQRIIQRHGGRVWAEGKVDEGATFSFSLPAAKAST